MAGMNLSPGDYVQLESVMLTKRGHDAPENRQESQREKRGEEKAKFTPPANQTVPCRRSPNQPPSKPAMNGTRPTARRFTTVKLPEISSAISTAFQLHLPRYGLNAPSPVNSNRLAIAATRSQVPSSTGIPSALRRCSVRYSSSPGYSTSVKPSAGGVSLRYSTKAVTWALKFAKGWKLAGSTTSIKLPSLWRPWGSMPNPSPGSSE